MYNNEDSFGYFSCFIFTFFLTPFFMFNILLLTAILSAQPIPFVIRMILSNIVLTLQLVIIGLSVHFVMTVLLSGLVHLPPSDIVCRIVYVTLACGGEARLAFMAVFATTVYILRCGKTKARIIPVFLAVVILWIFSTLPNVALFFPDVLEIHFIGKSACAAHGKSKTIIYTFAYIIVYSLCMLVVGIMFPLLAVRYVRKKRVADDFLKNMIKFAFLLLIGNSGNLIGIVTPILFITFAPSGEEYATLEAAFNYAEGLILMASLIPTPVIIIALFKPIRLKLRRISCFCCKKKGEDFR